MNATGAAAGAGALLLDGLFDYAGMFPPAALSFRDALRESARFPQTLHRPALVGADLVLTPENLGHLHNGAFEEAGWDPQRPCRICLVGVPVEHGPALAAAVQAFNRDRADAAPTQRIVSLELHLDDDLSHPGAVHDALATTRDALPDVQVYAEPKWPDAAWQERLDRVWGLLEGLRGGPEGRRVGLKFRCAGPTALTAPTIAQVLSGVAARRLPLKATQGLHHPFPSDPRHHNDHGFLNLAMALRLAQAGLGPEDLEPLLVDPEPALVLDAGLGWGEHRLLAQRVQEARRAVPFSIGSCSLAEPDEDLRLFLEA